MTEQDKIRYARELKAFVASHEPATELPSTSLTSSNSSPVKQGPIYPPLESPHSTPKQASEPPLKKPRKSVSQHESEKKEKKKDPNAPKAPLSAFMYFQQKNRQFVKLLLEKEHPELKLSGADVSQKLGEMWRDLPAEQKKPFEELAEQDRNRYNEEMKRYKGTKAYESTHEPKQPEGSSCTLL